MSLRSIKERLEAATKGPLDLMEFDSGTLELRCGKGFTTQLLPPIKSTPLRKAALRLFAHAPADLAALHRVAEAAFALDDGITRQQEIGEDFWTECKVLVLALRDARAALDEMP